MSTRTPRWVVIDDTDSRIHYNGPWFQNHQFFEGSDGPAFQNTLHSTQSNASLSFSFSGSAVIVWGTYYLPADIGVTVDCFIDNVSTGTTQSPVLHSQNNRVFCQQDSDALSDGPHTLTVNATVTGNQTFRFDDIHYVPSASVPLDNEIIRVDYQDPQLHYGQGWDTLLGATSVAGSILTFDFIGVSLSWYGEIEQGSSSQATYSIDEQTPINFGLTANPANTSSTFNQKFFQTAQLPAGHHTMKVVYQGNNNSVPLKLDRLIIQNGTLSSTTTSVASHATSATTATSITAAAAASASASASASNATISNAVSGTSNPGKGSIPVGAIVGGTIGGLALIVLAILVFLRLRRRRRKRVSVEEDFHTPSLLEFPTPYTLTKIPIHTPQSVSSSPSPSPLPSRAKREPQAESLATVEIQRHGDSPPTLISVQSNATSSQTVLFHEDSGIRMPQSPSTTSALMEIPPSYSVE